MGRIYVSLMCVMVLGRERSSGNMTQQERSHVLLHEIRRPLYSLCCRCSLYFKRLTWQTKKCKQTEYTTTHTHNSHSIDLIQRLDKLRVES